MAGKQKHAGIVVPLACLICITILLGACASDASSAEGNRQEAPAAADTGVYPMTVTDELGHEVTLPAKPTRIFAPVMEDFLVSLGVKPVARWSNGVKPLEYLQNSLGDVPTVSFASGLPSPETVLGLEPDLILLHNAFYAENGGYEQYSKIAPTYVFQNAAGDLNHSLRTLGQLLNEPEKAADALEEYGKKVAEAKAKLASKTEGKKAAIIRFNAKGMFFMNSGYYSGYVLFRELGFGESEIVKGGALEVSLEILPELDADYLFLVNDGNLGDGYLKMLKESPIWQAVPAVKNGNVYETNSDAWLSGGLIAHSRVIDDVVGFLAP